MLVIRYYMKIFVCLAVLLNAGVKSTNVQACGGIAADVVFILDTSGSISYADFQKELKFTKDVVKIFDVEPNRTHVGVTSFSTTVHHDVKLGEMNDKSEILSRIDKVPHSVGGTNTDRAIKFVRTNEFVPGTMREGVPHIAILLTDGHSYNTEKTIEEARKTREEGVTFFVIGVGDQVDRNELANITSQPTESHLFLAENFDALNTIKDTLAIKTCEVPVATPAPPLVNDDANAVCLPHEPVEIVFGFDITGIGTENAKFVLNFVNTVTLAIGSLSQPLSVSVISGGCGSKSEKNGVLINNAHSVQDIQNRLDTYTTLAYNSIMRTLRLKFNSTGMTKIAVMFIDKPLQEGEFGQSIRESKFMAFMKIDLFVIGVGERLNVQQANALTIKGRRFIWVEKYEYLMDKVADFLCFLTSKK